MLLHHTYTYTSDLEIKESKDESLSVTLCTFLSLCPLHLFIRKKEKERGY